MAVVNQLLERETWAQGCMHIFFRLHTLLPTVLIRFFVTPCRPYTVVIFWIGIPVEGFISYWYHGFLVSLQHLQHVVEHGCLFLRYIGVFARIFLDVEETRFVLVAAFCWLGRRRSARYNSVFEGGVGVRDIARFLQTWWWVPSIMTMA